MTSHSSNKAGFDPAGTTYTLTDPRLLERADFDLWNDQMYLHLDHRGRGKGAFMQPNPQAYAGEGRWFYLRDMDSGKLWSAPFGPVYADPDSFSFAVTPDQLSWEMVMDSVQVRLRVALPVKDVVEFWQLEITNLGTGSRRLECIPAIPLGFPGRLDQQSGYEDGLGGIIMRYFPYYVKIEDYDRLAGWKNISYCLVDKKPENWETRQEAFTGFGDFSHPELLRTGNWVEGRSFYQESIAALRYPMTLIEGETFSLRLLVGPAANDTEIEQIRQRYMQPEAEKILLEERKQFRASFPPGIQVETPDPVFNHYVNHWLPDRVLRVGRTLRFNYAPQARNAIQDAMAATLMDPKTAQKWFSRIWSFQHKDGFMPHGLRMDPHADVMPITTIPHKDSGVWGPPALRCYLAETGDWDMLQRVVSYVDGGSDTIYEHLCRNLEWLLNDRTERGLSKIGQGDWNDPLNMAGPEGKGESVWLTEALAYALENWAEVSTVLGENAKAERFLQEAENCRKAVNELSWDGQWYQRATTDDGAILGAEKCQEGQIFLNAQSWSLIGKVASPERFQSLRASVCARLQTPAGPALLLPAYRAMRRNVGKITLKTPGTGENGSVYCHAVVFWAYGLFMYRDPNTAWENLRRLLPDGDSGRSIVDADQLPLYIPNFYRGPTFTPIAGKSSHSPNTGTSSWYLRTVVDGLFGLRAELDGLTIDPQLPAAWKSARARRNFRGATYVVDVARGDVSAPQVCLDGVVLNGNKLPLPELGTLHNVSVIIP